MLGFFDVCTVPSVAWAALFRMAFGSFYHIVLGRVLGGLGEQNKTKTSGGTLSTWLVSSPPDQAVWAQSLAGDNTRQGTILKARHTTLRVPLSTQVGTENFNAGGNPAIDQHPI